MGIVEVAQDREGLDAVALADEIGVAGAGEHRLVFRPGGAADARLVARRALYRHDGVEVGGGGGAKDEVGPRDEIGHGQSHCAAGGDCLYARTDVAASGRLAQR